MEENLNIVIDGIKFTLVGKFVHNGYNMIAYTSETPGEKINKFLCYRSNSEGGIPRLAWCLIIGGYKECFYKGEHYIMTTSLHNDLLKFTNENDDKLRNLDHYEIKEYTNMLNSKEYSDELYDSIEGTGEKHEHEWRYVEDNIFSVLEKCVPGICLVDVDNIQKFIEELGEKNKYERKFKEIIDSKKKCLNMTHPNKGTLLKLWTKKLFEAISEYLDKYFYVDWNSKVYWGQYKMKADNFIYDGRYQKVTIHRKKKLEDQINSYDIIICNYDYESKSAERIKQERGFEKFTYNKITNYNYVCSIIPTTAKITKFGIPNKIVNPGIYIYKPLEYGGQFERFGYGKIYLEKLNKSLRESFLERFVPKRGTNIQALKGRQYYVFIGDLLNNIFPNVPTKGLSLLTLINYAINYIQNDLDKILEPTIFNYFKQININEKLEINKINQNKLNKLLTAIKHLLYKGYYHLFKMFYMSPFFPYLMILEKGDIENMMARKDYNIFKQEVQCIQYEKNSKKLKISIDNLNDHLSKIKCMSSINWNNPVRYSSYLSKNYYFSFPNYLEKIFDKDKPFRLETSPAKIYFHLLEIFMKIDHYLNINTIQNFNNINTCQQKPEKKLSSEKRREDELYEKLKDLPLDEAIGFPFIQYFEEIRKEEAKKKLKDLPLDEAISFPFIQYLEEMRKEEAKKKLKDLSLDKEVDAPFIGGHKNINFLKYKKYKNKYLNLKKQHF